MLWKNWVFLNGEGGSRKGRRCARLPMNWAAKNAKDRCKCGQSTNLGACVRVITEELDMNRETVRQIWEWEKYEFIAQGQTVNQQCYLEVLTRLWGFVWRKRPELWPDKWILQHDDAPAHDALRVQEFLAKNAITNVDHPPYSPDLARCDFWLFPKLKKCPEGTKICWHFWHPTQRENITARYSGKRFSRLFPAVAPSSHEVHSFTRRVFRRWQQLLVHR